MTSDVGLARRLRRIIATVKRCWQRSFNEVALALAQSLARSAMGRADSACLWSFDQAGFAVDSRRTREVSDALQATIGENDGLNHSIAAEHLADVEGIVTHNVRADKRSAA
jgi:hypothetical protein